MVKRSTVSRILAELLGFCLAALFGFAMSAAIDLLFTRPLTGFAVALSRWPLILCYLAGRFCAIKYPEKENDSLEKEIICIAAVVVSLILTAFTTLHLSDRGWFGGLLFSAVPAVLLLIVGLNCVPVFPQGYALASVVVYLFDIIGLSVVLRYEQLTPIVSICTILDFLLVLISANVKSTADGVHKPGTIAPAGISSKSFMMLVVLTAVSFAIALAIALRGWIAEILVTIAQLILRFILWFAAFIASLFPQRGRKDPELHGEREDFGDITASIADRVLVYVFFAVFALVMIVLITRFVRKLLKNRKPGKRKKRRLFQHASALEDDEVESTIDLYGFFDKMKEELADSLKKLKRKPTFSDMKTDAEKVRFAFREFKRQRKESEKAENSYKIETSTPLDLAETEDNEALRRLAEDYSALKYGDIDPGTTGGQNAGDSMQELKNRKKKQSRKEQ